MDLRRRSARSGSPQLYPEYAADYYATFFEDPDGIRLEVTNFREERRRRFVHFERDAGEIRSEVQVKVAAQDIFYR